MDIINKDNQINAGLNETRQDSTVDYHSQSSKAHIEKIVSQKCKIHPIKNLEFLHLAQDSKNIRLCIDCVQEQDIPSQSYLQIKDVLQAQSDTDLITYPIINDQQLRIKIKSHGSLVDSVQEQMNKYFTSQTKLITDKAEMCKQAQKMNMIKLAGLFRNAQDCWNEMANIQELQRILYKEKNNEKELCQFVNNHLKRSEAYTQKLGSLWKQFEDMKEMFSTDQPNKIMGIVYQALDEINFFQGSQIAPLKVVLQSDQYISALQQKQREFDELQKQFKEYKQSVQVEKAQQQRQYGEIEKQKSQFNKEIDEKNKEIAALKSELKDRHSLTEYNQYLFDLRKELVAFKPVDLMPSTRLIASTFEKSPNYTIINNKLSLVLINETNCNYDGQAYLNFILDPFTNYIIHVELLQTEEQQKWFLFGLVSDKQKDSIWGKAEKLCYCEWRGQFGMKTLIKGKPTSSADILERKSLEMRININRQILRVGSLPNYDSVVIADNPQNINQATPYRFFLSGLNQNSKMIITKIEQVREFDELM